MPAKKTSPSKSLHFDFNKLVSDKTLTESGFLKGIIIVAVCATTLIVANFGIRALKQDPDFNILSEIIDQVGQIKNGPKGCCKPLCNNDYQAVCEQSAGLSWSENKCNQDPECEKGCCQVDCLVKENFPKASCLASQGQFSPKQCVIGCCQSETGKQQLPELTCTSCLEGSWTPGECGKGFSIHLQGSSGGEAQFGEEINSLFKAFSGGGIDTQVDITLDLYTCNENPLSTWKGKSTIHTKASNPKVQTKDKTETHDMTLAFNSEGTIHNEMTKDFAKLFDAKLDGNQMMVKYNMIFIDPIVMTGTIKSGAKQCQNEENKN
jgi:hypothetical protein